MNKCYAFRINRKENIKIMTKCHLQKNIYDFMSYKRSVKSVKEIKPLCDLVKMLSL